MTEGFLGSSSHEDISNFTVMASKTDGQIPVTGFHSNCGSACEYKFIRFKFSVICTSYIIRILCDMVQFWLVGA